MTLSMTYPNKCARTPPWRRTFGRPFLYWATGTIFLWLMLPASLIDILLAMKWHAPHWQCDSIGIPIMYTYAALIPWASMSAVIAALITLPMTWRRKGGADILDLRLGKAPWKWIVTIPVAVMVILVCTNLLRHFWLAAVPQTITADCSGRAEPITLEMRGPLLQFTPVCETAIAIWLMHLRALALSPMRNAK